jgi:glycosyltransferase involved in cell wall biosynthesis
MGLPFVTCIMPTANREKFVPLAVGYFTEQNYPNKELVIIDDGSRSVADLLPSNPQLRYFYTEPLGSIGLKRNYAIEKARGSIIIHWDDDDWHAFDWISQEVNFLLKTGADITGIRHAHHYSPIMGSFWQGDAENRNNPNSKVWLHGATLAYQKAYWEKHPFKDLQKGEDEEFVQHPDANVYAHEYIDGFIAILHPHNTTVKPFEELRFKKNQ